MTEFWHPTGSAPARGGCEQAERAGTLDGPRSTESPTTRRGTADAQLRVDDVVGVRGPPG